MRRATRSRAFIVLLVVLVVSPLAAASGGAAAGYGDTVALQQDATTSSDQPTLEQLRAGGERPDKAPPSIRASGTYSEFALKYLPTGLFIDDSQDSQHWRYLERGTTVKRDKLQLWSKRGYGEPSQNATVRIAHYSVGETQRGNETVPVAENVTTYSIDASLAGGYDLVEVELDSHFQSAAKTVICVEQAGEPNCLTHPNGVRWHLNHQTSEAAKATSLDSEGDKLAWGLGYLLLPFLGSSLSSMFGVRKAIDRAKSAPVIPWWVWPVALVASVVSLFVFWDQLVATSIRAPWALSLVGGGITGLVAAVWFGASRQSSVFFRLRPREFIDTPEGGGVDDRDQEGKAVADGGETEAEDTRAKPGLASSSIVADVIPISMVHGSNGERYHVAKGFFNWIARARGAVAPLETADPDQSLHTRIDVERGPYDEMYFLDPEAPDDEVLEYEPEGHDWSFPQIVWKDEDGWHVDVSSMVGGAFIFGLVSLLGEVLLASAKIGLLIAGVIIALWKFATPSEGTLRASLANVHYIRALPTVITNAKQIAEASTKEELFDKWQGAEMDRRVDHQELEDRRDRTQTDRLVDRYLGATDDVESPSSSVTSERPETSSTDEKETPADD